MVRFSSYGCWICYEFITSHPSRSTTYVLYSTSTYIDRCYQPNPQPQGGHIITRSKATCLRSLARSAWLSPRGDHFFTTTTSAPLSSASPRRYTAGLQSRPDRNYITTAAPTFPELLPPSPPLVPSPSPSPPHAGVRAAARSAQGGPPARMSSPHGGLDDQIERLMQCKPLPEAEVTNQPPPSSGALPPACLPFSLAGGPGWAGLARSGGIQAPRGAGRGSGGDRGSGAPFRC